MTHERFGMRNGNPILRLGKTPPHDAWQCHTELQTPTPEQTTCVVTCIDAGVEFRVTWPTSTTTAEAMDYAIHNFAEVFGIYAAEVAEDMDAIDRKHGIVP